MKVFLNRLVGISAVAFLCLSQDALAAKKTTGGIQTSSGRPKTQCKEDLPNLTVGKENILTRETWDAFNKKYPMYLLGITDSSQESMCDSEPILNDFQVQFDKKKFTYPLYSKKKKQTIRKPMTVARIDVADKKQTEKFRAIGVEVGMLPTIYVVLKGDLYRYDGLNSSFDILMFMMQHLEQPLIEFKYEDHIMDFLDTSESRLYEEDYKNGLLDRETINKNVDQYVGAIGFMTRVTAFFYGADEYKDEIKLLAFVAKKLAHRMNLRISIVKDKELINKMKKKHPYMFEDVSKSSMVLRRYDGELMKLDISSAESATYNWWINVNSKKPVDELGQGAFQIGESANMPLVIVYVTFDFEKRPKAARRCTEALDALKRVAPQYNKNFMIYYTSDPAQMAQRRVMGISWDKLPSMGLNTLQHNVYTYGRDTPFDEENLEQWFISLTKGTAKMSESIFGDIIDEKLYPNWLSISEQANRTKWNEEILRDLDHDSLVFFYSTATLSYQQRGFAYQFSEAAKKILDHEAKGSVPGIKIYSYDLSVHAYPKGITKGNGLPEDTDGSMDGTYEYEMAGIPKLCILPADNKGLPYRLYEGVFNTKAIIDWVTKFASNPLKITKALPIEQNLAADDKAFLGLLRKEGIVQLEGPARSFVKNEFTLANKSDMMVPKEEKEDTTDEAAETDTSDDSDAETEEEEEKLAEYEEL